MSEQEEKEIKKAKKPNRRKPSKIAIELIESIIERIRGKEIKKQLAFLLNPETIETSSRLTRNQVMAINSAQWLALTFKRFLPLKDFWVGTDDKKGGFARWVISSEGKGRIEAINFMQAQTEPKIISPVISGMRGEEKKKKRMFRKE